MANDAHDNAQTDREMLAKVNMRQCQLCSEPFDIGSQPTALYCSARCARCANQGANQGGPIGLDPGDAMEIDDQIIRKARDLHQHFCERHFCLVITATRNAHERELAEAIQRTCEKMFAEDAS